jgi:hypothetical protein
MSEFLAPAYFFLADLFGFDDLDYVRVFHRLLSSSSLASLDR